MQSKKNSKMLNNSAFLWILCCLTIIICVQIILNTTKHSINDHIVACFFFQSKLCVDFECFCCCNCYMPCYVMVMDGIFDCLLYCFKISWNPFAYIHIVLCKPKLYNVEFLLDLLRDSYWSGLILSQKRNWSLFE